MTESTLVTYIQEVCGIPGWDVIVSFISPAVPGFVNHEVPLLLALLCMAHLVSQLHFGTDSGPPVASPAIALVKMKSCC
jgi:hypothetical protein